MAISQETLRALISRKGEGIPPEVLERLVKGVFTEEEADEGEETWFEYAGGLKEFERFARVIYEIGFIDGAAKRNFNS